MSANKQQQQHIQCNPTSGNRGGVECKCTLPLPWDVEIGSRKNNSIRFEKKGGSGKAMAKYYREHDKVPKGNSHNMQNLVHADFSYNFQITFNQHIVEQMVNYNEVIRHKCTLQTTKGFSSNVMENFNALFFTP